MLTKDFPFLLPRHVGRELSARLRSLADDLDRAHGATGPTTEDLASAPLFVDWRCVLSPLGSRLAGFVAGNPILGNRPTLTSQVWAADACGTWIRTLSRFYRLGVQSRSHLTADLGGGDGADDFEGGL
jgi:hypothetical protein